MKELRKIKNPWLHKPGYDCICCSPTNPIGLHLEFWEDGEDVITRWKPSTHYQGWLDTLHGGIQSMLLDEVAGWVVTRKRAAIPRCPRVSSSGANEIAAPIGFIAHY